MYKVKHFLLFLARLYIAFTFRKKEVYVVTGMRRSGNHAFINWFTNALENREATFNIVRGNVSLSSTGDTVFFNEVNYFGLMYFISAIRDHKLSIIKSSFIIISLEDYSPKKRDIYTPYNAKKISITRSSLNLIASRLHKQIEQAKIGFSRGDMSIDVNFFNRLSWNQNAGRLGWTLWNYDSWLTNNANYRKDFLFIFKLQSDISPKISKEGGGSSFSGTNTIPSAEQLISRWQKILWPTELLKLLVEPNNIKVLTKDEKLFIENELAKIKLTTKP
jgi:hypothetical protein